MNAAQKRVPSAPPAASAFTVLVTPEGHRVPELPLVVEGKVEGCRKTRDAVLLLKKRHARNDITGVRASQ